MTMKARYFVIVYDNKSLRISDYIAAMYHMKHDIIYLNEEHPKEKKEAFYYKSIAGTTMCPFLGAYDEDNGIVDALWGEVTEITRETVDSFFKKYE